jgi:hypothetical protein
MRVGFAPCINDQHVNDHEYLNRLHAQMDSGGREAMLYDLLHRDLTNANVRTPPATVALWEQKQHSMPPEQRWWLEKLTDGVMLSEDSEWRTQIPRTELRDDFAQALRFERMHTGERASATALGMFLAKVLPQSYPRDTRPGGTRCWQFQPLAECRSFFEQIAHTTIPWPDVERSQAQTPSPAIPAIQPR